MNDEPKPKMHPVDAAIITDFMMPDDEPMTWDERDGRYPHAVDDDISGVQAQDMGIWFDEADGDGDGA